MNPVGTNIRSYLNSMSAGHHITGIPGLCLLLLLFVLLSSCKKEELLDPDRLFNTDAPVLNYPKVRLNGVSRDTVEVGDTLTLYGTGFEHILNVKMSDQEVETYNIKLDTIGSEDPETGEVSYSDTLILSVPRRSVEGQLSVEDKYGQTTDLGKEIIFTYPFVAVFTYPEFIERERRFKLGGKSVDLLKEVILVGEHSRVTLPVKPDNVVSQDEITVLTIGVMIPDSLVSMEFVTLTEQVEILIPANGVSDRLIPVIDPQPYDPVDPLILWRFDTDPLFNDSEAQFGAVAETGLNLAEGVEPVRGDFFTVSLNKVPETPETPRGASWAYLGRIQREEMPDGSTPIDLGSFNEPHLTFLVNTNNHYGYFQFVVSTEDGVKYGTHGLFNFIFQNQGWQWKSYKFEDLRWELWSGEGPKSPDPNGTYEYMRLGYTTADIPTGSYFEISVDEVMITDGPLMITDTLFLFEDGEDAFTGAPSTASSYTSSVNGSSVGAHEGQYYQTITIDAAAGQNETIGEIRYSGGYREALQYYNAPHISFWVNTGEKRGFLKVIAYEGETRFICNLGEFDTNGEWELVTVNIRAQTVHEDGTEEEIDFKKMTDLAVEVYTGSAENGEELEINLDYIVVSEGPLF